MEYRASIKENGTPIVGGLFQEPIKKAYARDDGSGSMMFYGYAKLSSGVECTIMYAMAPIDTVRQNYNLVEVKR